MLILDLDSTLVYSTRSPRTRDGYSFMRVSEHWVKPRPHLDEFLRVVSAWFRVVVWTAGTEEYAGEIIQETFRVQPLPRVLGKKACSLVTFPGCQGQFYIKDLSKIKGCDPNTTLIVEDTLFSFALQPNRGILIKPYNGERQDDTLPMLLMYLWFARIGLCSEINTYDWREDVLRIMNACPWLLDSYDQTVSSAGCTGMCWRQWGAHYWPQYSQVQASVPQWLHAGSPVGGFRQPGFPVS
jgi:hypothetical protein